MSVGLLAGAGVGSSALPRRLHPGAWWAWALGLAVAASRTTNPLLLGLILAVAGYVVASRKTDAPWGRSYSAYLKLGLVVIGIRVVVTVLFGASMPGTVLVRLPQLHLPGWALGVRVGGPVTRESVAAAVYDGLRLATLLACVGAANALANPRRLLRLLPGALYEVGVAVVVAISFSPQLIESVARVREARRLRGQATGRIPGLRWLPGVRRVAMPVLEDALERSLDLAAAMDSRGYGRRADVATATRRTTAGLVLGGLLGVCVGLYGLLDAGSLGPVGLPLLLAGLALAAAGLRLGGVRTVRSRYRPDPWAAPEWIVMGSGAVAALVVLAVSIADPAALMAATGPFTAPTLPLLPAAAVLTALLPAWAAPLPAPRPARSRPSTPSTSTTPGGGPR